MCLKYNFLFGFKKYFKTESLADIDIRKFFQKSLAKFHENRVPFNIRAIIIIKT